jgi:paraquat-inducible protein A
MDLPERVKTAREQGLVGCTRCTRPSPAGTPHCPRCGSRLQSRDAMSLQKVWAWWLVGLGCYIPANLYPMLETRTLVSTQSDTIVGGAVDLARHGNWGVAAIILIASVLIPVGKFVVLAGLAIGVRHGPQISETWRHRLYEVVEYIGRWSMIDVFVVAILSSLVQLQALASITPGRASLFFALSVIFTMLSAQSFDSRLIWDSAEGARPARNPKKGIA